MFKVIVLAIILLALFVQFGGSFSYLKPYHQKFIIGYLFIKADFLSGVTLDRDALDIYEKLLAEYPQDNHLKVTLKEKIEKIKNNLLKIEIYQKEGLKEKIK